MSSQNTTSNSEAGSPDINKTEVENMNGGSAAVNGTNSDKRKSTVKSSDEESDFNGDYEKLTFEDLIADCLFPDLIEKMRVIHYNINTDEKTAYYESIINAKCKLLFERDYKVEIVKNQFTENYPKEIIIPVAKKDDNEATAMSFDAEEYSKLVYESLNARLRSRFVVPAILFDNKFICRSGTLTVYISSLYERIKSSIPSVGDITEAVLSPLSVLKNTLCAATGMAWETLQLIVGTDPMKPIFDKDGKVLKHLQVERICDLMIEYNKHFKQAVNVSSTEKVHEELYQDVKMEEMPYPGCEFFTKYAEAKRQPEGLLFDWSQSDVTRTLELTEDPKLFFPDMDIENRKEWDLIKLTQNYLKIMLSYIVRETGGIVVHCISGWDRTPLFISLIRLSLWADGVIHQNLNFKEMAYLTVAYDWFLFGHNLPDRLAKNEEVMHFCFNFLKYITSDEFSTTRMFKELPLEIKGNRTLPEFVPGRRECLDDLRHYVLSTYSTRILDPRPTSE